MSKKDFLLEIGCEELPPKLLKKYADALLANMIVRLAEARIVYEGDAKWLASPRRLAVLINGLALEIPAQAFERTGPAVNTAYDKSGNPTPALLGFAKSCHVELDQLEKTLVNNIEKICYKTMLPAKPVIDALPDVVHKAINDLPIAKPMRWGSHTTEFIRPVHWILMLLGSDVIPSEILGKKTDRITYGHRFLSAQARSITLPDDYLEELRKGHVMVDFIERRNTIKAEIETAATKINGKTIVDEDLLDEVTAIVEWPEILTAQFDKRFLDVPQEALMSSMQQHQKSFPVVDTNGKILPYFIFVSNIISKDPQAVITGNEKVMRARLSDAAFFYKTDLKTPLAHHLDSLKKVVFQTGLASQFERSERIATLAEYIAKKIGVDSTLAYRAGLLSKCDLMTAMVGEFPELQGIMGSYYALESGESKDIALAIKEQYKPGFANDTLPAGSLGNCVALAEKIDTLVGIFGINQKPSGTKDPFGLRRAAIGVVRIFVEQKIDISLSEIILFSKSLFNHLPNDSVARDVTSYILDRMINWAESHQIFVNQFHSVRYHDCSLAANDRQSNPHHNLYDYAQRLYALRDIDPNILTKLVNIAKRVNNMITSIPLNPTEKVDEELLLEPAEQALYTEFQHIDAEVQSLLTDRKYVKILKKLSQLTPPTENFCDNVKVNLDDSKIKQNRFNLLCHLNKLLNSVAALSHL